MINELAKRLHCHQFVVTRGRKGCTIRWNDGGFVEVPAFAQKVVDRVGAGDAFFAVTSLAAAQGVKSEVLGFIGNAVGSLAVEIIGNQKSIDKSSTLKYITALFK
jgi:sugar/nucleoside kinase (ribokinase family)